jgi:hypothetical protein
MTWAGRGTTFGLLAASVLLCFVINAEISNGLLGGASYSVTPRISVALRQGPMDAEAAPDRHSDWQREILARPLFSPTRRPVETAAVSGLPRLTGIVVTGSERIAIFAAPANEHPIVAQAGAHVGAYEVKTIADTGVTVVGPGGTTLIRPIFDVARPASSVPPPALTPVPRAQPTRPATH